MPEVHRVGQLGEVRLYVVVFQSVSLPEYRAAASFPAMDQAARTFRLGALSHRNFRLFLLSGHLAHRTWMQAVALGWLVLEITDSPFAVA